MKEKYDCLISLASIPNLDRTICEETKLRSSKTLELYRAGKSDKILIGGGNGGKEFAPSITGAKSSKLHLISKGVPEKDILGSGFSNDTIGELCFAKWLFLDPDKFKKLKFISSDYHIPRSKVIAEYLFDDSYELSFESVDTGGNFRELKKAEPEKLKPFFKTFKGVQAHDDKAIFKRLFSKHRRYNDLNKKINKKVFTKILELNPEWKN